MVDTARWFEQGSLDKKRKAYRIFFPADLTPEQVATFLNGISGSMHRKSGLFGLSQPTPSLVFEIWATTQGIEHWLKVPWEYEQAIVPVFLTLVPGAKLEASTEPPSARWTHAVEAGIKNSHRPLHIADATALSANILTRHSQLDTDETLMIQWVVSPSTPEHKPVHGDAKTKEFRWQSLLSGNMLATHDEVNERRTKLDEHNFYAVLRIGSVANTPTRAAHLVDNVIAAFKSTNGPAHHLKHRALVRDVPHRIAVGASPDPLRPPMVLNVSELTALLGWRIGSPMVAGLPPLISRSLPTPSTVPTDGIILGASNYPGRERDIAVSFKNALTHTHVCGPSGVGKTVLLANMFKQIVDAGHGAVVVQVAGDLFQKCLDYIPSHRIDDVIVLDVGDTKMPVGWNFLREGPPEIVVDEVLNIFKHLYRDHPSMWASQALYHGLHTLAADKDATFIDLLSLVSPTKDEVNWSHRLRGQVKDPQLVRYWQDLENTGIVKQEAKMEPLASRVWPMSRSKLVNIVGQSTSSFHMEDVVKGNKILLINLAGIEREAAALMATLLTNSLWNTVKRNPMPDKPNYLIADEAQHIMDLPIDLQDLLVEARKFGLGIIAAHQHLGQLPNDMKYALMHSAPTKIVFQTGADDAREFPRILGKEITDQDLMHLHKYEAVARIATDAGVTSPLTLTTREPARGYGNSGRVIYTSRGRYGRPVQKVQEEIIARRTSEIAQRKKRQPPKVDGWGI